MIHQVDGDYVISSGHRWLPGIYADKRTANYAFRFTDEELAELRDTLKQVITFEHLQTFRQMLKQRQS